MLYLRYMRKILKILGYIILVLVSLLLVFFAGLYARYTTQSEAIHSTVNSFVEQTRSGTSASLAPYVHPEFSGPLDDLLNQNGQLFEHIAHVDEKKTYFDYSWNYGVGETTIYKGDIALDSGDVGDIQIKLIKYQGRWVVYGVDITPRQVAK